MPLTPADVHNVAFKKPPIGKRGYDEEEVDAFLDEVERELARLIEENNELRAPLERDARQRHQEAMGGLDAKRTALQKHIEELKQFEREYRTRLKAYLESQLRDLTGREQSLEAEMASRNETPARTAAAGGGLAAAGLAGGYVG